MKVLAIDPGPERSAFVRWDTETNDFVDDGSQTMGIEENWVLLHSISSLHATMDLVAIEMVQSYGMGVGREIFETCLWAGRFLQNVALCPVKMYGRPTIKGAIGGRTDAEIRASLRIRHGEAKKGCKLEGVKKDIWSALALATALTDNPKLKEW